MLPLLLALLLSLFFGLSLSSGAFLEGFDDKLEAREILHPVHIDDYEFASGYVKRDGETVFDHLVPSEQTHLSYGRPASEHLISNYCAVEHPLMVLVAGKKPMP
jgi:hypothetical protein